MIANDKIRSGEFRSRQSRIRLKYIRVNGGNGFA
jgi:hypothetical protein